MVAILYYFQCYQIPQKVAWNFAIQLHLLTKSCQVVYRVQPIVMAGLVPLVNWPITNIIIYCSSLNTPLAPKRPFSVLGTVKPVVPKLPPPPIPRTPTIIFADFVHLATTKVKITLFAHAVAHVWICIWQGLFHIGLHVLASVQVWFQRKTVVHK